jgi:hypothetical protein
MLNKIAVSFGKNSRRQITSIAARNFGAMDEINRELFEHKFTTDMKFISSFEKMKCFRVMDEDGKIINPGYDTKIPDAEILKMYDAMVTMNEADQVYNAAQR